jgi:hypothetical protein
MVNSRQMVRTSQRDRPPSLLNWGREGARPKHWVPLLPVVRRHDGSQTAHRHAPGFTGYDARAAIGSHAFSRSMIVLNVTSIPRGLPTADSPLDRRPNRRRVSQDRKPRMR